MPLDWKNIPSLSSLRAFDTTARMGNFARASRDLNVTHAAIAQQVRRLESELGVSLVRRQGRNVALTPDGTRLASALRSGFDAIAGGVDDLRRDEHRRGLRVTTTPNIADALILHRMSEFWSLHPDIEVSLLPGESCVEIDPDEFRELDLAVRGGPGNWPGLNAELLGEYEFVAAGSPELLGETTPPFDELPWLWTENESGEKLLGEKIGLDPSKIRKIDVGSPHLEMSAVRQGLCVCVVPEIIVRKDLESGRLKQFPIPSLPSARYYAVTAPGPMRPSVDIFIKWLKSIFRE